MIVVRNGDPNHDGETFMVKKYIRSLVQLFTEMTKVIDWVATSDFFSW